VVDAPEPEKIQQPLYTDGKTQSHFRAILNNTPDGQGMLKDLDTKFSPDTMRAVLPLLAELFEHMNAERAAAGGKIYDEMNPEQQKKVRVFLSEFKSRMKPALRAVRARMHNAPKGSNAITTAEALRIIRKHIT
jgi:hypothetical protein